jgi:site-specific DNA-methyltransferase (adenine-specific)
MGWAHATLTPPEAVKPTPLMRWLCRLVTPPGGVVLDPFMGSGSTGKAAVLEGFSFVGIDREAEYVEIARRRIDAARLPLFVEVTA